MARRVSISGCDPLPPGSAAVTVRSYQPPTAPVGTDSVAVLAATPPPGSTNVHVGPPGTS